jgi:hypothetical protein
VRRGVVAFTSTFALTAVRSSLNDAHVTTTRTTALRPPTTQIVDAEPFDCPTCGATFRSFATWTRTDKACVALRRARQDARPVDATMDVQPATDDVDHVGRFPVKATPRERAARGSDVPTDKQKAFVRTLLAERGGVHTAESVRSLLNDHRTAGTLTRKVVSKAIETLLATPKAPAAHVPASAPQVAQDAPQVVDVPAGHYAIASRGTNDLMFVRVDRPTEGKWAGRTFVKMIVGGHPDAPVARNRVADVLARIVEAGTDDAARLYGQEIGRCCRCNRTLTDEASRAAGIGPDCATK